MRTFKTLCTKCFRDIVRNLKQFIAIIFILAVAVTLFIGLEANSKEFDRRVDEVYTKGNVSDIWVTVTPSFLAGGEDNPEADYEKLVEIAGGDERSIEKRLYLPTTVDNFSSIAIISSTFPHINKPYDVEKLDNVNASNFFFVDKDLANRYMLMTNHELNLGDKLEITIDGSYFTSIGNGLKENVPYLIESIKKSITDNEELTDTQKDGLISLINANKEAISNIIIGFIDSIFTGETYNMKFPVNGFMKHPENIQTATFNNSCFLLSNKLIMNDLIDKVTEGIKTDSDIEIIQDIKNFILLYIDEFKKQINNDTNPDIKKILDGLVNQYTIKLPKNIKSDDAIKQINDYYEPIGTLMAVMDLNNMPSNSVVQNDIYQSRQLTYCFPLIFFAVAILVVLTTISQLILKERTQIGTLKSLGLSKTKILLYYMVQMSIVALLGVGLGLILGPLLIPGVMNIKYKILYSLPPMHYLFPWLSSTIVLVGTIVTISILTFALIKNELRLSPAMSMRPKAPMINLKEKTKSIKNISLMMAFRNIKVHFTKSLMVVLGVMGCTGLLICGFGIEDVIDYGIKTDTSNILGANLQVNYNVGALKDGVRQKLLELRTPDDERLCERVEELSILQTNVHFNEKSVNTFIYYLPADTEHFNYTSWDPYDDGIGINESRAKDLGLKEGDYVDFSFNGNTYRKKIVKIFYTFSVSGLFIYQETMPELTDVRTNAWITVNPNVTHDEAKQIISDSGIKEVNSVLTHDETIHRVDGYVVSVRSMTNTVKIFAIILAVIVLINLSILNFTERLRDIATLKVLGYSKWEIARSLIYETMILTFVGALLGMALGLPLEIIVLMTNETPLVAWKYIVYPMSYVIAMLLSIITAGLVNVIMSTRINKISMSESLKSVE